MYFDLKDDFFISVLEKICDAYIILKPTEEDNEEKDLQIIDLSSTLEEITGRTKEYSISKNLQELILDTSINNSFFELLRNTLLNHQSINSEYYSTINNKWYSVKTIVFQTDYILVCLFDITLDKLKDLELTHKNDDIIQLKKDKKLVEISEKRYKILVNSLGDIIYSCNLDGVITMVNKMFCQLTGKTEKKIIGTKITSYFNAEKTDAAWSKAIKELIETKSPSYLEYEYVLSDGNTRFYQASLSPISDLNNNVVGFIGSNQDITRLKLNEQKMISLAYHDSLTNLPNKTLFLDRLKTAISISARNRVKIGVAFVDLDNFKRLNAVYGHDIGDKLLTNVAQKLVSCVRNYDTVARFSEDKFLVLFQHINHGSELFSVFERIRLALLEPFSINMHSISLTASIGISIYPDDGGNAEEIILKADTAMDKAKLSGKNCYYFYNDNYKAAIERQNMLKAMLSNAINNNEFLLYYQPHYEIRTRKLRGFEALLRWDNPEIGLVMPGEFIVFAEETLQIIPIGKWVIENACEMCKMINKKFGLNLLVSVNISPIQLKQQDFYDTVLNAVKKSGLDPSNLELDIKESTIIENFDTIVSVLEKLKKAGIKIALDNFGLGGLSLSQLKKLPLNIVKLDKELLNYIEYPNSQGALTDSIIDLIHNLDIEMLAEGVENKEQVDYLTKGNCDNYQGFFFAEPVDKEKLEEIIERGISENEAVSRMIHKIGLTYEELFKQRTKNIGSNWDIRQ